MCKFASTKPLFTFIPTSSNPIFSVRGALAGIGAGLVIKSFVSTGRSIEDLNVSIFEDLKFYEYFFFLDFSRKDKSFFC